MALKVDGQVITESTSSYLQIPVGSIAQRPISPTPGMVRFNTESTTMEVYSEFMQNGVLNKTWQTLLTTGGYSSTPVNNEATYTTPGTYTWVCPTGVTIAAVVCVGGGGSGGGSIATGGAYGGGGGGSQTASSPGAAGAVRIVWGPGTSNTGRQFPLNSVGAL